MYRTYEPARDRLVAVKAIRLDLTPEQARALADELQRVADAGLDHPSIVRPLAAGVESTVAYAASEYVAAESLDVAMRHYAPATLDKVLPFITQLAGAIDYARTAGVGHGALHPRDIFVTPEEARATGFGVVQAIERLGVRAPVRRPYTAPERVDGGEWDVRADVYSLAAIAYELLTGRRPVGAEPGSLGPTAGPYEEAVAVVLARALAAAAESRYATALGFAAALEAASRGDRATGAIEQVRAIEEAPAGARALVVEREGDDHILDEIRDEDVAVERDEGLADIQLREEEAVLDEAARRQAPDQAAEPAPIAPEPTLAEEGEGAGDATTALTGERELRGTDEDLAVARGPSLFDDQETENVIPEVQHPRFAPQPPPAPREPVGDVEGRERVEVRGRVAGREAVSGREPTDRFEPEPVQPIEPFEPIEPVRARSHRPGPPLLPAAVMLLLGLFVGFLGGYLVGSRESEAPAPEQAAAPAAEQTTSPAPSTASPATAGRRPAAPPPQAREPAPQRAAETAPAPATRGRLVVRSIPAGAQVFVNGRRRGTTPLAIPNLDAATYTVRLTRSGYQEQTRRVSVSGGVRDVTFRLERQPARRAAAPARPGQAAPAPSAARPPAPERSAFTGSLFVDSRPRGARVLLDGRAIGVTPLQVGDIKAGSHVVRIELDGHRAWSTATSIVAGQVSRVTASLERER